MMGMKYFNLSPLLDMIFSIKIDRKEFIHILETYNVVLVKSISNGSLTKKEYPVFGILNISSDDSNKFDFIPDTRRCLYTEDIIPDGIYLTQTCDINNSYLTVFCKDMSIITEIDSNTLQLILELNVIEL